MYDYRVKLIKVVDGDTVDFLVDQGFGCYIKMRFRLYGINAPETRTRDLVEKEKGIESKTYLHNRLKGKTNIVVKTFKKRKSQDEKRGSFGRYLAEIFLGDISINREMLDKGLANKYE